MIMSQINNCSEMRTYSIVDACEKQIERKKIYSVVQGCKFYKHMQLKYLKQYDNYHNDNYHSCTLSPLSRRQFLNLAESPSQKKKRKQFFEDDVDYESLDLSSLKLQGGLDEYLPSKFKNLFNTSESNSFTESFKRGLRFGMPGKFNGDCKDYLISLIEDTFVLTRSLSNAQTDMDYWVAIAAYHKSQHAKGSLTYLMLDNPLVERFKNIFTPKQQTFDPNMVLDQLKGSLEKYDEIKNSPIFKKLYKFLMYCLSMSLFDKVGITFDSLKYSKIEAEAIKREYYLGPDFVHCLISTLIFVCERGHQCMITGSLDPIYHSGGSYEKWYDSVRTLKRNSNFLSNPEAHGFTYYEFMSDLDNAIDIGKSIAQHVVRMGDIEKKLVKSLLADLEFIKGSELNKRASRKDRDLPFSMLIFGESSVGKSTFINILFYHYARLFNLPHGDEYKYTRNPADQFWVNFVTSMWCLVLDDIAFFNPDKAPNGDPSMMECIQILNRISYMPNQADLTDKGRTPLRSKFVIGTTNTENLNAHAYFSCPLAVRRRFPYIIELTPKKEYTKDNMMLDSSKVPAPVAGEYPDFWTIIVKRVIPGSKIHNKRMGDVEVVKIYEDINDFIQWFSEVAILHDKEQTQVSAGTELIKNVELCNACHRPIIKCVCELQTDDNDDTSYINFDRVNNFIKERFRQREEAGLESEHENTYFEDFQCTMESASWFDYFKCMFFGLFIFCYCKLWIVRVIASNLFGIGKYGICYHLINTEPYLKFFMSYMGKRVQTKLGKYMFLVRTLEALSALYCAYKASSTLWNMFNNRGTFLNVQKGESDEEPEAPMISKEIGCAPKADREKKRNVWYTDSYELTNFDVTPTTLSYKKFDKTEIVKLLENNCVHLKIDRGNNMSRSNRAVCISGHTYMTNDHFVPEDQDEFFMTITQGYTSSTVNNNITIKVTKDEIVRRPEYDLCFINIRSLPPKKDIQNLFCKDTLRGSHNGYYLARNANGTLFERDVKRIERQVMNFDLVKAKNFWMGRVYTDTQNGDCGALLIIETQVGPVIGGIHAVGAPSLVGSVVVTQDMLDDVKEEFSIQSGEPLLSDEGYEQIVESLHWKSPLRFIPSGTANAYGSFKGERDNSKSRVIDTCIKDSMVKRGYDVKFGKPVMNDYRPWRIALLDMVNPVTKINMTILENSKQSFLKDIFESISEEKLKEVMVYDDITAINGAADVAYVDKINRNTSAGNPWKKTKKAFIHAIPPINGLQEPVMANPEIMSRVNKCIETYISGCRYMPNFCAHLKDEPIKFKKIEMGKTRVFTGAPFDWTIVVRKYLLSVIKLIQENRFTFESAPGTVAQSTEWGDIYYYLTKFGKDRIVAGDYSAFDKRMPSSVILAAFDIIVEICRKAGYTDEELRVVRGIAEDTAFPLVDFHGDLIEFYGSNPSGHLLTVIVNGLANCLYMRYCYSVLSPNKNCDDFKSNVTLMTYGDDNIMGVSRHCDFFDHTKIVKVLEEINIKYTMADKESESVPFIHIDNANFLKRTWRYDVDVKGILCPLEHESIEKMLTVCVASKTISSETQAVAVIATALREYFFYGKQVYEEKMEMFKEVIEENDLQFYVEDYVFPSWQSLCDDFWEASKQ